MAEPAKRNARYDDLLSVPYNMTGEIIGGELIATPRPAHRHIFAASCLRAELIPPYQLGRGGPGGWIILAEPEIHFSPEDIIVPDYAGWRKERFATPAGEHRYRVIPDWVCEILSPSTAQRDRIVKMRLFARYRLPSVWLIDPELTRLNQFTNKGLPVHTSTTGSLIWTPG